MLIEVRSGDRVFNAEYPMPDRLQEMVERWGEDVVTNYTKSALKASLNTTIRGALQKGASDDEIVAAVQSWKPGSRRSAGGNARERLRVKILRLSDEERAALLADVQAA